MVLLDRYSRWPECKVFKKAPDANMTCEALRGIFRNKGIPLEIQSDNGPPFQSVAMRRFSVEMGYRHRHVTPEWPRANGMVERFNRSMKEAVQAGCIEGKKLKESVNDFVEMYRATPHSATSVSPFEAMHGGRKMKLRLPMTIGKDDVINRKKEEEYKKKMVDSRPGKCHNLKVGDTVLMRQKKQNKLTTRFNPEKLKVTEVRGSSIEAVDNQGVSVFRDASFFKRIDSGDDEDDEIQEQQADPVVDIADETDEVADGADEVADEPEVGETAVPAEVQNPEPSIARSRPRRQTRAPAKLGDYVCPMCMGAPCAC